MKTPKNVNYLYSNYIRKRDETVKIQNILTFNHYMLDFFGKTIDGLEQSSEKSVRRKYIDKSN